MKFPIILSLLAIPLQTRSQTSASDDSRLQEIRALKPSSNVAERMEYLDDRNGMYSGTGQALKGLSLIADHTFAAGFLARAEYRRDFSNQPFFLTDAADALRRAQTSATLGLMYWWGTKQGAW